MIFGILRKFWIDVVKNKIEKKFFQNEKKSEQKHLKNIFGFFPKFEQKNRKIENRNFRIFEKIRIFGFSKFRSFSFFCLRILSIFQVVSLIKYHYTDVVFIQEPKNHT